MICFCGANFSKQSFSIEDLPFGRICRDCGWMMNAPALIKFEGARWRGGFSMNWMMYWLLLFCCFSNLATPKFSTSSRGVRAMVIWVCDWLWSCCMAVQLMSIKLSPHARMNGWFCGRSFVAALTAPPVPNGSFS